MKSTWIYSYMAFLAAALFFVMRSYYIFSVFVLPKYIYVLGANKNPFVDSKFYYNYPTYFAVSVFLLLFLIILIFLLAMKNRNNNPMLYLLISVVALYIVNLNTSLSSMLVTKVQLDVSEHDQEIRTKNNVDMYTKCGCMECIKKCKE